MLKQSGLYFLFDTLAKFNLFILLRLFVLGGGGPGLTSSVTLLALDISKGALHKHRYLTSVTTHVSGAVRLSGGTLTN
jgi:hypothetical protein